MNALEKRKKNDQMPRAERPDFVCCHLGDKAETSRPETGQHYLGPALLGASATVIMHELHARTAAPQAGSAWPKARHRQHTFTSVACHGCSTRASYSYGHDCSTGALYSYGHGCSTGALYSYGHGCSTGAHAAEPGQTGPAAPRAGPTDRVPRRRAPP